MQTKRMLLRVNAWQCPAFVAPRRCALALFSTATCRSHARSRQAGREANVRQRRTCGCGRLAETMLSVP